MKWFLSYPPAESRSTSISSDDPVQISHRWSCTTCVSSVGGRCTQDEVGGSWNPYQDPYINWEALRRWFIAPLPCILFRTNTGTFVGSATAQTTYTIYAWYQGTSSCSLRFSHLAIHNPAFSSHARVSSTPCPNHADLHSTEVQNSPRLPLAQSLDMWTDWSGRGLRPIYPPDLSTFPDALPLIRFLV